MTYQDKTKTVNEHWTHFVDNVDWSEVVATPLLQTPHGHAPLTITFIFQTFTFSPLATSFLLCSSLVVAIRMRSRSSQGNPPLASFVTTSTILAESIGVNTESLYSHLHIEAAAVSLPHPHLKLLQINMFYSLTRTLLYNINFKIVRMLCPR